MNLSKLALGTAQFGFSYGIANQEGQVSLNEIDKILDFSQTKGIHTLDTAIAYGASESRLGLIGVDGWNVISKLPSIPDDCTNIQDWVSKSIEKSLDRLKISSLYGLLLHKPNQLYEGNGSALYEALCYVKKIGMVKHIGISIYAPEELIHLEDFMDLDIIQNPFNILDKRILEDDMLTKLNKRGFQIHTRSAFLQGLLLMEPLTRPPIFSRWNRLWEIYDGFISGCGMNRLEVCVNYVLSFNGINNVVIGVDNCGQLKEICNAVTGTKIILPEDLKTDDIMLLNPAFWPYLN